VPQAEGVHLRCRQRRQRAAEHVDRAPVGAQQAAEDGQQRALARPGRAHDQRQLARCDRERDCSDDVTYLTETFATEAVEFLRRADPSRPWFLYLAFNAVHVPLQATPELLARVSHIPEGKEQIYAAMLLGLDDAIRTVMHELDRLGQAENTFVWFQSDNGGPLAQGASNFPLKGGKATLNEGGIRVPTYISWPGRIRAGRVMQGPISGLDLVPTALAAASVPAAANLDGIDVLPSLLSANVPIPGRPLAWRLNTTCTDSELRPSLFAVRQGRWKLIEWNGVTRVYDLQTDVGETTPVDRPSTLAMLLRTKQNWEAQMPEPLWCDIPGTAAP
jgi:arylsulfatase A-like enzyme